MNEDIKQLAKYCDLALNLKDANLSDEYFYQSLPLCVIDAVYSIGVKYAGKLSADFFFSMPTKLDVIGESLERCLKLIPELESKGERSTKAGKLKPN